MPDPRTVHLDLIDIKTPCPADWDAMEGDDTVRFCDQCRLHVYNLSGMTRGDAQDLVQSHEGRLCVRFYRRPDGKLLTTDCGPIRRARKAARRAVAAAAVLLFAIPCGLAAAFSDNNPKPRTDITQLKPIRTVLNWLYPQTATMDGKPAPPMGAVVPPASVMGGMRPPPPPAVMGDVMTEPLPPTTQPNIPEATTQPALMGKVLNLPTTQPATPATQPAVRRPTPQERIWEIGGLG